MSVQTAVITVAAIATALMAGLFFAYTFSVNPGLHRLGDGEYIEAMQSINRGIQNPVFFAAFFGALLLLPASVWAAWSRPVTTRFLLLLIAAVVYAAGVFGVTAAGNVPLNEALNKFDASGASTSQISAQRALFEGPWNRLNAVRTAASVVALVLVIAACIVNRDGD